MKVVMSHFQCELNSICFLWIFCIRFDILIRNFWFLKRPNLSSSMHHWQWLWLDSQSSLDITQLPTIYTPCPQPEKNRRKWYRSSNNSSFHSNIQQHLLLLPEVHPYPSPDKKKLCSGEDILNVDFRQSRTCHINDSNIVISFSWSFFVSN